MKIEKLEIPKNITVYGWKQAMDNSLEIMCVMFNKLIDTINYNNDCVISNMVKESDSRDKKEKRTK